MFYGVIASWKLECKCKRLLWTEYWYSKLFRLLWKFLNISDIFDYLDSISKHKGMKNLEKRECVHIIKCAKVHALSAENWVRFSRAAQLWCEMIG